MQGQLCDYSNRSPVKTAVADGERDAPELPSHIAEAFYVGGVRFWRGKGENPKIYLAMCAVDNPTVPPKVQWYMNDEPCNKDAVQPFLLASENVKPQAKETIEDKGQARFFGIDITNILEIR